MPRAAITHVRCFFRGSAVTQHAANARLQSSRVIHSRWLTLRRIEEQFHRTSAQAAKILRSYIEDQKHGRRIRCMLYLHVPPYLAKETNDIYPCEYC